MKQMLPIHFRALTPPPPSPAKTLGCFQAAFEAAPPSCSQTLSHCKSALAAFVPLPLDSGPQGLEPCFMCGSLKNGGPKWNPWTGRITPA